MDAAIAGLLGTAIGAGASLITVWIQAFYQSKREKARFVLEYAASDRQSTIEQCRANGVGGPIPPVALFAHYNQGLLKLLESGNVTTAELQKLSDENEKLWQAIKLIDQERRRSDQQQPGVPR